VPFDTRTLATARERAKILVELTTTPRRRHADELDDAT
jgi:hypothetical protein